MTLKLENNNIKTTSPTGKVTYSTIHWLKNLLPIIEAEWTVEKTIVKGVFDKLPKGEVEVKKFVKLKEYSDNYFDKMIELLEKGERVVIAKWSFELEPVSKIALIP